ncbi:hypothetical protein VOLCADRAFT_87881 [Volvox carteri f. nagariensis]|uniref:NADP-dependent oxidoreductase domain-containing protein n=1 Tax=Volvox carteri f. nagariensis TaxID=3068 RepID=D8TMH4_VOLCA|nr:uncharacterized protein VOLCADRAFT_87881 [Volvox carteri f. nagariensis]EFJ51123.1 hypothetical protein VOLCADRAFT_87881 [Volvox carteri f. nagariensis]|eukprot:XP_002947590.1 hypothetical protein VOLCADRAFT_87881 [Volvox carteri f. nagariensis]
MSTSSNPIGTLGASGISTARLGYGCMSLSGNLYAGAPPEEDAIALLRRAYDLGVRLFNTSDLYGPYTNEELLAKALPLDLYPDAIIATKWGAMFVPGRGITQDNSRGNCRRCCEGALKRLQRPSLDIFTYRGPPDPSKGVSIAETMEECKLLLAEGKIRGVGLSEVSAEQIREAAAVVPISVVEQEWSLFTRDAEEEIIPTCRELGISILAYSPLGRGILTGALRSVEQLQESDFRRKANPRFDNLDKNLVLVDRLSELAQRKGGCTPGQLALAWVLARGPDVFPIPGTRSIKNLEENLGSCALAAALSQEELQELEIAVPAEQVVGDRYPHMSITFHGAKKAAHSAT